MAIIHFLDGKHRGKTKIDDKAITDEGTYRFKKREISKTKGRRYYVKAVPKKRWADRDVPEWTTALEDDPGD